MRQATFLMVCLIMATTALGQDWEGDLLGAQGQLHGTVGMTYESKFIWRGFDIYDDKSAVHFLADLDLFETGFGMSIVGHRANSSGFEKGERWDYTPYYQNGLFPGETLATNFRLGWVWYNHPQQNTGESLDMQEGFALMSWPNLLPIRGLMPSYAAIKMWPSRGDSRLPDAASGWMHILMLDYGFSIEGPTPEIPEQVIKLHAECVYNDGVTITNDRRYRNPDHGWSHAVLGVSTELNLDYNLTLKPAVYYQVTMEDTVNEDDDELWGSLGLTYSF